MKKGKNTEGASFNASKTLTFIYRTTTNFLISETPLPFTNFKKYIPSEKKPKSTDAGNVTSFFCKT
jgi:hypothetical protein